MQQGLDLAKYNPHWQVGFSYPYTKKRKLFHRLLSYLDKRQIVEIHGLRRTGKTVLMLQMINHLLKEETDRFHILYFTFDERIADLDNLFTSFTKQTGIDYRREKIFIFLDEIQKLANFQNQLKIYYDLYSAMKFFLSGSTSLYLKKKSQESLAGRIFSFLLPPLDFEEYLLFKEKLAILEKPLAFKTELESEFELFLRSQFVESIGLKDPGERKEYFISIIKKIIFEDIPAVFPIENPQALWQIIRVIGSRPGMLVDYQRLAKELGLSSKTVSLYLYFLEEAFLVKKLYNFSKNLLTSEKRLKKYYLASPSFCAAISDFPETGLLVENFVISLKGINFFWRDVYKNEVDFVAVQDKTIIPMEAKYTDHLENSDLRHVWRFLEKFKAEKGVVFSKEFREKKVVRSGKTIVTEPIFFLSSV